MRRDTRSSGGGRDPMLIRAVVHARLLGLRLLTLDARIVLADADASSFELVEAVSDVDPISVPLVADDASGRGVTGVQSGNGRTSYAVDGGLARARELLADGAQTLATARRS